MSNQIVARNFLGKVTKFGAFASILKELTFEARAGTEFSDQFSDRRQSIASTQLSLKISFTGASHFKTRALCRSLVLVL